MKEGPTGQKSPRRPRTPATIPIGFRVDAYYRTLLEKGAAAYGISLHAYARQRLKELLDHQEETRLLGELQAAQAELRALREDVARTLEIVLVNVTKAEPARVQK